MKHISAETHLRTLSVTYRELRVHVVDNRYVRSVNTPYFFIYRLYEATWRRQRKVRLGFDLPHVRKRLNSAVAKDHHRDDYRLQNIP